jgi:uncharacterized membrane protein YccC
MVCSGDSLSLAAAQQTRVRSCEAQILCGGRIMMGMLSQIARTSVFALSRELVAWKPSGERAVFGAQAMLSVGLSVAFTYALHLPDAWWAAISAVAVTQTEFLDSAKRGTQCLLGTVLGALLGSVMAPWIGDVPWLFVPALGLIGGIAVYRATGSEDAYAWILGAVTALMVIFEAHRLLSASSTLEFAATRVADVAVGTLACVFVSGSFHIGTWTHRKTPAPSPLATAPPVIGPSTPPLESTGSVRWLLAWQGGLTISILAALGYALELSSFPQAMVTTIAVLALPAESLAVNAPRPVIERMVHRFGGCLLAGAVGLALLPLTSGDAIACTFALMLGIWIGCHVQTGREGASYIGRQFTIAFIMIFVQDNHWSAEPGPALARLAGILSGIVVLGAVMLIVTRLCSCIRHA